jgi:RNA-directed DNA polymerase
LSNQKWEESVSQAKSFEISKQVVWDAYKRIRANQGSAGVDEESIQDFEANLKDNLYKLWNRMSSGSYFPPAVRGIEIPKASGGKRSLGIPTVTDRIAQMVAKIYLEPKLEPYFHKDSYGYRPKKSAIEALGVARERCWRYDWALDLDIRGFFDNLDHELLMRAVRKHTNCKWIVLYIERWLKAPVQLEDGALINRAKGTPQGGVISPLLANLFLHYALDEWIKKNYPDILFERYADDAVFHCVSESEVEALKKAIGARLAECRLEPHPQKTRIVYCKDDRRRGSYPNEKFDFLGYTFRPRGAVDRSGKLFVGFNPAVSNDAVKSMRQTMRKWKLHRRADKELLDLSRMNNPIIRGWVNYYGKYYKTELYPTFHHLNRTLVRWAMKKYKRLRTHQRKASYWLGDIARRDPQLFAHWQMGAKPATARR